MRAGMVAGVLAGAFAVFGAVAEPALAGPGLNVRLYNRTGEHGTPPADVELTRNGKSHCWDDHALGDNPPRYASPTGEVVYYTEKRNPLISSCTGADGFREVVLRLREPGQSDWYTPQGENPYYHLYYQHSRHNRTAGFRIGANLQTWAPRKDGRGLVCWHAAVGNPKSDEIRIYVYSDVEPGHCGIEVASNLGPDYTANSEAKANTPVAQPPPAARARPGRTRAPADNGAIINLLSTIGVLCPWYAFPGKTAECNGFNIGNEADWVVDNVSREVRNFRITDTVGTNDPRTSVGTAELAVPSTSEEGYLAVEENVATSEETSTTTTHGGGVGVTFGFAQRASAKLPFFGDGGVEFRQEINTEYNYSKATTESTTKTVTRSVYISATALPGFTTTLDVFTAKRAAEFKYAANLDFGKTDVAQPVLTPASLALNQSPARRQPCLAYAVGNEQVRNSIMFSGRALLAAGYSPDEPTLPAARRAFLRSLPYFQTPPSRCPGFPCCFASVGQFKGDGVGSYDNFGYDEKGQPVKVMTGCVYQTPFPPARRTAALAHSRLAPPTARPPDRRTPCKTVPVSGGIVTGETPGRLLDYRAGPANIVAPPGSDEIFGPRSGGTIYTNNGALDIVHAGPGSTRVFGGSGENVIYGGSGNDTLVGGQGGSNYLHAGAGTDVMREAGGFAVMHGGRGADTFEGTNMKGVMAGGSGPSRMIARGDLSHLEMVGGRGATIYELEGPGTPQILQLPESAPSTLMTDHSMAVPAYVHDAIATGSGHVTLRSAVGTRLLQANNAGDTLISGPGAVWLRGGRGRDTIVFNPYNDDLATGGAGADRYEFTGSPETQQRPRSLQYPAARTAATITNFNPAKGDRLVLRAAVFGRAIITLARHFKLVVARDPRPRGRGSTLLLSTRTGVLSFDPDGNGPISDKVIVKVPHLKTIKRAWLILSA